MAELNRIVVKIGTTLLTKENGQLDIDFLIKIAREIKRLHTNKREVVLVTSGAVAAGRAELKFGQHETLSERQALAAVGQGLLMGQYHKVFTKEHGITIAQVLLQSHDFENLDTLQNTHNSLKLLLAQGVLPIVNENDVTATDELKYMANDRLAASVANLLGADGLVILTDVVGLYEVDPRDDPAAKLVTEVRKSDLKKYAAGESNGSGHGGMRTKCEAAKAAECPVWLADGNVKNVLSQIVLKNENPGTRIG